MVIINNVELWIFNAVTIAANNRSLLGRWGEAGQISGQKDAD